MTIQLPSHHFYVPQGADITPGSPLAQRYSTGIVIVLDKVRRDIGDKIDQNPAGDTLVDALLVGDTEKVNAVFDTLPSEYDQVKALQHINAISVGYSTVSELGVASEAFRAGRLYTMSSDFFDNALKFISANIFKRKSNTPMLLDISSNIMASYVDYLIELHHKAKLEQEILGNDNGAVDMISNRLLMIDQMAKNLGINLRKILSTQNGFHFTDIVYRLDLLIKSSEVS